MEETINFTPDFGAKENTSTIKVIGVGGGGSTTLYVLVKYVTSPVVTTFVWV